MGGLITEASPLNFPDGASLVDQNMDMFSDGSRRRRKGLRIEPNTSPLGEQTTDFMPMSKTYYWKRAGKAGNEDILVILDGYTVWFYREVVNDDVAELEAVGNYDLSITFPVAEEVYFTDIQGYLLITGRSPSVEIAEYNEEIKEVEFTTSRLKVRDLWGIETPFASDYRPPIFDITDEEMSLHAYNLYNNGFPLAVQSPERYSSNDTQSGMVYAQGLTTVFARWTGESEDGISGGVSQMFAESDIWTQGFIDQPEDLGEWRAWSPETFLRNSPEPTGRIESKGRFVLDVFNRGDSRKDQVSELLSKYTIGPDPTPTLDVSFYPEDRSTGKIGASAAYSGRVFYTIKEDFRSETDANTPSLQNFILFSETVNNKASLVRCHGRLDPSSMESPDVLDTDGGFISIPDMGTVLAMETLGSSLFVFADNGLWEVSGGRSVFSASNLSVTKVTGTGASGSQGVVNLKDMILFVSSDGINVLQIDPRDRQPVVEDLTQDKIRTFFSERSSLTKSKMRGAFFEEEDQVRWLFTDDVEGSETETYTDELIFELQYGAFRLNKYPSNVNLKGYVNRRRGIEYIRRVPNSGVLELRLSDFKEGPSSTGGVVDNLFSDEGAGELGDAEEQALIITGSFTGGAPSSEKRVGGHFVVHMGKTEDETIDTESGTVPLDPSGCIAQARWGWHISPAGNKWSRPQQVYRLPRFFTPNEGTNDYDIGYSIITTKNRLRGRGTALSIQFASEEGKNMVLYGWGLEWTVKERF